MARLEDHHMTMPDAPSPRLSEERVAELIKAYAGAYLDKWDSDVCNALTELAELRALRASTGDGERARNLFEEMGCVADDEKCIAMIEREFQAVREECAKLLEMPPGELELMAGEMNAGERRTVKAVLANRAAAIRQRGTTP
jgi:hypothetical protein